uniref:Polyprotein n=1 Tax=Oryza sativa subsp. japonica TaxID=39947 RepID=Q850U2_ORYSJ|nr:putative polyprotein [Oryza sativa Japonica Group]
MAPELKEEMAQLNLYIVPHGQINTLDIQPILRTQIEEAQKDNEEIREVKERLAAGFAKEFSTDEKDVLCGDVTTGGGSGAQARRRTTARRRERRTPTCRGRLGELTGDQNNGGRSTDGDGVEEEAAATFGLTMATVFRWPTATTEGRTRSVMAWRSRRRPSRATTTTGAAAAHGWTNGGDGGARLHGARALPTAAGKGKGGGR